MLLAVRKLQALNRAEDLFGRFPFVSQKVVISSSYFSVLSVVSLPFSPGETWSSFKVFSLKTELKPIVFRRKMLILVSSCCLET